MHLQLHERRSAGASSVPRAMTTLGHKPPDRCPVCEHRFCICPDKQGEPQP